MGHEREVKFFNVITEIFMLKLMAVIGEVIKSLNTCILKLREFIHPY